MSEGPLAEMCASSSFFARNLSTQTPSLVQGKNTHVLISDGVLPIPPSSPSNFWPSWALDPCAATSSNNSFLMTQRGTIGLSYSARPSCTEGELRISLVDLCLNSLKFGSQMDDILPRVGYWKPEPWFLEPALSLGIPLRTFFGFQMYDTMLTTVLRFTVHEYDVSILCCTLWCFTDVPTTSWVVIPILLMVDSYAHIAGTLRAAKAASGKPKRAWYWPRVHLTCIWSDFMMTYLVLSLTRGE